MIYLLDTNVCIRIINKKSLSAREKLLNTPVNDIVICSIVRAELFYGASKSQTPLLTRQKQDEFLRPYQTLPFDDICATVYGKLRFDLERQGTPIGPLDMQIASIALAHNLVLVTHNIREFSRVNGLKIEDWEGVL
jgi:tRNA(fMet)-specific endonuclease VapC